MGDRERFSGHSGFKVSLGGGGRWRGTYWSLWLSGKSRVGDGGGRIGHSGFKISLGWGEMERDLVVTVAIR